MSDLNSSRKHWPDTSRLHAIRNAWGEEDRLAFGTPLSRDLGPGDLDKFQGCLIGGAAGDALGYPIEFDSEEEIFSHYGPEGIRDYALSGGIARISDDTQMTLFTANGLLSGVTRGRLRGIQGPMSAYIGEAYEDWYLTQTRKPPLEEDRDCWLCYVPELFSRRAPGHTCLSAIGSHTSGSPETPINHSKGCGGVMRVAPIGLYYDGSAPALQVDLLGADAAALTHGHELGYIPAAMLVHMVWLLSHSRDITLDQAVEDGKIAMKALFSGAAHLEEFLVLVDRAVELSHGDLPDPEAIHALGEGWVAEETMAIAIYCALKYRDDFDRAIRAAVNHRGDSDSTGAVTGNILGAYLGLSRIPRKYTDALELRDVILEIAGDLYEDCDVDEYRDPETDTEKAWYEKYVYVLRGRL